MSETLRPQCLRRQCQSDLNFTEWVQKKVPKEVGNMVIEICVSCVHNCWFK